MILMIESWLTVMIHIFVYSKHSGLIEFNFLVHFYG